MTLWEDIFAKLRVEPITRFNLEPEQGNINQIELELAKRVAKIKTTGDIVEKGFKSGFLVIVIGGVKERTVIGNHAVEWTNLKDSGGYDKTIQTKDSSFDRSRGEKKHARRLIEYEVPWGGRKHTNTPIGIS